MSPSKKSVLETLHFLDGAGTAAEISMAMYGSDVQSQRVARALTDLRKEGKVEYEKPASGAATWYIPC